MECCRSLYQNIVIVNLIASKGYVYQFVEKAGLLALIITLGFRGRGNLAACFIAFSVFGPSYAIMHASVGGLMFRLRQTSMSGDDHRIADCMKQAMVGVVFMTISLVAVILVVSLVMFGILFVKVKVLYKAHWFMLLLTPSILLEGLQAILLIQHDYLNRSRPIFVSAILSSAIMMIGCLLLSIVLPLGLTGCAIVLLSAKLASVLFLAASVGSISTLRRGVAMGFQMLKRSVRMTKDMQFVLQGENAVEMVSTNHLSSRRSHNPLDNERSSRRRKAGSIHHSSTNIGSDEDDSGDNSESKKGDESDSDESASEGEDRAPFLRTVETSEGEVAKKRWTNTRLLLRGVLKLVVMGLPGIFVVAAECILFYASPLLLSSLGTVALDAFQFQMTFSRFAVWTTVYPLSVATSLRIRALLKSDHAGDSIFVVWMTFLQCSLLAAFHGLFIYYGKSFLWSWFTSNNDILQRMRQTTGYVALYAMVHVYLLWAVGVYRAAGMTYTFVSLFFIAQWVIGAPLSIYLAIFARPVYNLSGYWIGWLVGSGLVAIATVFQCLCLIRWQRVRARLLAKTQRQASRESTWRPQSRPHRSHGHGENSDLEDETDNLLTVGPPVDAGSIDLYGVDDLVLFGDVAPLSVYSSYSLGSFLITANTLEDDILELEIDEMDEELGTDIKGGSTTRSR